MKRIRIITLNVLFLLFFKNTLANNTNDYELNENNLKLLIQENNPTIEKINSIYQQNLINEIEFNKNYDYNIYGNVDYKKTTNDDKKWTSIRTNNELYFEGGIKRNLVYGIDGDISITNKKGNYYAKGMLPHENYDLNEPSLSVNLSIDLWKNFLGYHDLANKLNVELNKQQSEIKLKIEKNNFYSSLRVLYWNLMIKNKELHIYEQMIKQAEKNLKNVNKKFKSYIVDKGDLAKAKANLSAKEANYNNVKVEIENIKQQIKYYVPELMNKNIIVNNFDLTDTFDKIMKCNKVIYSNEFNWEKYTSYNEYIKLMDKIFNTNLKMYERYSDFDINLNIGASIRGIDDSVGSSYEDLSKIKRNDYSIGLTVNKTLGDNNKNLENEKIKLLRMNYNVNKRETVANLESFYTSYNGIMKNMFSYLNNLHLYKKSIEIRVESSRKKYEQGRMSLNELIQDEDSLIDANMQIVRIENQILKTILEYLSTFDKVECDFNIKL